MTARNMLSSHLVAVSFCCLVSCGSTTIEQRKAPVPSSQESVCYGAHRGSSTAMSVDKLLAHAAEYDGKVVRVTGFFTNQREDHALYSSAADATRTPAAGPRLARCRVPIPLGWRPKMPLRSVWWETPDGEVSCANVNAVVEGTFDACQAGHMDLFAGGIMNVTYIGTP